MNAKQLADQYEWLYPFPGDIPYEIVLANTPTDNFIKFCRRGPVYCVGHNDFVDKMPLYINGHKATDILQYMQYQICKALEADFRRQTREGKSIRFLVIKQLDDNYFYSLDFPLIAWMIDIDGMDMMMRGYVWVDKSTVTI